MKTLLAVSALSALALSGAAAAQPRGAGASITLYDLPNYQGQSRTYQSGVDNLADVGLNDRAQSARVQGRWRLCTDAHLRGRCVEITGDTPNLATVGVTAAVSSFEPLVRQDNFGGRDDRGANGPNGGFGGPGYDRGGGYDRGQGQGGFGGGYPPPPPPSYGRNDAGQSLEGRSATFFPNPNPGPYRNADEFCRRLGFSGMIYADDRGRGLRDVLCRR